MDLKHRSRALTEGRDRAAARAYLKGIGYDDEALSKPIIGVANTWTETMPCNFHLRALAKHVKDGIKAAGGTPMEFNTVAISDGITMGTSGMKTSLVSREVVADSIELVTLGHFFDAVICLCACDKTIPGTVMALARLDVPGVMLYGGSIPPGHYQGRDITIMDVFEAIGANAAGQITDQDLADIEAAASPGAGACGGQFTANTMAMAFEMMGISPIGPSLAPAQDATKPEIAYKAGELVMDVLRRGQKPSEIITRESLENAILSVAASGGSTNGVLHLLAVAREAGVPLDIDDFDRIAESTPSLCDLKPGGRFVATDLHAAGGTAVLAEPPQGARAASRRRARPSPARRSASTPTRRTRPPAKRSSARSATRSRRPAASRSSEATSPPRAASSSSPATSAATTRGPPVSSRARKRRCKRSPPARSTPATSSSSATRARPAAPACARCWRSRRRSWGRGSATPSRCSPTAASPAPHEASWPATSPPRPCTGARSRPSEKGDAITIDVDARRIDLDVPDDEIEARLSDYEPPEPQHTTGVLAKYAALVSSASEGAITRPETKIPVPR